MTGFLERGQLLPLAADLVLSALLLAMVILGWKRGFLRLFVLSFSLLLALLVTYFFHAQLAELLGSMGLREALSGWMSETLFQDFLPPVSQEMASEEALHLAKDAFSREGAGAIASLAIPTILKNSLVMGETAASYARLGVSSLAEYVTASLSELVLKAGAAMVLFAVSYLLLRQISKLLTFMNHVPLLGIINRLLGAVWEAGLCVMFIYLLAALLVALSPGRPLLTEAANMFSESLIGGFIMGLGKPLT